MKQMTRRGLLRAAGLATLGALAAACAPQAMGAALPTAAAPEPTRAAEPARTLAALPTAAGPTQAAAGAGADAAPAADLAVVHGADAREITRRAIAAIGGIERFLQPGYDVIIKPNICNANHGPEYASTTNPDVVAALVEMCRGAGAGRVRVMDYPFSGTAAAAYARSGIEAAVTAAGGEMEVMNPARFVETRIPEGQDIKEWPVYQPILEANLVINVPIAKHHNLTRLTLGGKNLLGMIENRGAMHRNMGPRVADIYSLVRPALTVIDAVRILTANGPTGGNLADVKELNTVVAGADMVACDAYATSFFDRKPEEISYVAECAARGLGTLDLASIQIDELSL